VFFFGLDVGRFDLWRIELGVRTSFNSRSLYRLQQTGANERHKYRERERERERESESGRGESAG
jgi:hypothetical protein